MYGWQYFFFKFHKNVNVAMKIYRQYFYYEYLFFIFPQFSDPSLWFNYLSINGTIKYSTKTGWNLGTTLTFIHLSDPYGWHHISQNQNLFHFFNINQRKKYVIVIPAQKATQDVRSPMNVIICNSHISGQPIIK